MNIATAREALQGPIPSLRTPFTPEGDVDHQALAAMVEFDLAAGARALVLTYGDSHLDILSEEEVAGVHRRVAEAAGGRGFKVAADRNLDTRRAVSFARQCVDWGFDIIMIKPPDWGGSTTAESLVEHYRAVAHVMPVMLVTNIFISRGAGFGHQVITRVLEEVPGVVAIKDDMGGAFAREMCARHADRAAIWAGGQKQNHLNIAPYGACGYLSTFLTFAPAVAHRYWQACQRGDHAAAAEVIARFDMPLFQYALAHPGGFDAVLHAVMEIAGLARRWRRPPHASLTEAQMTDLRRFLQGLNLPTG